MAKKKKYYVVWEGRRPGIYDTWEECRANVLGAKGAKYKSFSSREEAIRAFKKGPGHSAEQKHDPTSLAQKGILKNSIAVDAACSGNPGIMEYRGVSIDTGKEIFRKGPFRDGTNNIGEFLAIVHALALLNKNGQHDTPIYSDSRTAISWVRNKKVNTTLEPTPHNSILFELIERALQWLKTHHYKNPIYKWETKKWGEIPADFGRK